MHWALRSRRRPAGVKSYPQLRPGDVHDALAYAYDHPDEIEGEIASDAESSVMEQWPGGGGTP